MSTQPRNDDASELREAAEEKEVLKLEQEVERMAQKILEYRTTIPEQLSSTLSSLLASQVPVLPSNIVHEGPGPETRILPVSESEAGVNEGLMRGKMALSVAESVAEADEKIQTLKLKIASNTAALLVVLNRIQEYMLRIDKLDSSNVVIHSAFKRNRAC